ncbi:MAG: response regulator [Lachnospiraceae bacterium]|nr:response regulator [Lachnospiraceae bacterium]
MMKSIQTKIIIVISVIIILVVVAFLITSTARTNAILEEDSENILLSSADYYANVIDDNFRSTEQSVGTIYNYALARADTYVSFLDDEEERDHYTYDIAELSKSIADNTRGAMSVYLRYNPEDYGASNGFWYTIDLKDGSYHPSVPTDMSLYDRNDLEHVGWYYIPVETGKPLWMSPYYNANLGVEMISYIIPYYNGNYTVGVIGMDISMDLLREAVAGINVYQSGRAFLLDDKGNLIYHRDYPEGIDYPSMDTVDQEYFSRFLAMEPDKAEVMVGRDGTMLKVILKELRNGMILGVYAPLSEINVPQKTLLIQLLIISAIILLAAIVAVLMWVRTITEPLKKMTAVAEHYANGNFDEEIKMTGDDEVGILSRSLQTMSTSLQRQIDIANSANRAKSEFLANMSHEIRTPINAMLGMNEMILKETSDREILEYASNIRSSGKTLLSLINGILDFSKIEDGKMEILPVKYDPAKMIHNLENSILARVREKNLELEINIDESLPRELFGDDVRVSQVIGNLLTNAVKYTESGRISFSVKDGGRSDGGIDLAVSVTDTGIGIREEDIDKLCHSFSRLEEKRNRNIEGTGLGMAIVTKLLSMMESSLSIQSVYGEGSSFSFRLRQQIVDATPIGDYREYIRETAEDESIETDVRFLGADILVVDDNDMNLKVAKGFLKLYGIVPDLVLSGKQAVEAARKKPYHLILLDYMMPGMDGLETLKALTKENLLPPVTKVIVLTANAVVGAKEMYLRQGFDDYLSKPLEMVQLKKMLLKYLPEELLVREEEGGAEEDDELVIEFDPVASEPAADEAAFDALSDKLSAIGIETGTGLKHSANSKSLYMELLGDYADTSGQRIRALTEAYSENNWESYRILIHSLKGVSAMIGAPAIASKAKELEDASKDGNETFMREHHSVFLTEFERFITAIRFILGKEQ